MFQNISRDSGFLHTFETRCAWKIKICFVCCISLPFSPVIYMCWLFHILVPLSWIYGTLLMNSETWDSIRRRSGDEPAWINWQTDDEITSLCGCSSECEITSLSRLCLKESRFQTHKRQCLSSKDSRISVFILIMMKPLNQQMQTRSTENRKHVVVVTKILRSRNLF